jgi:NADH dehydrogenase FAD-containing subunit
VPNGAKANRPIKNASKKWNRLLSAATDTEGDETVTENDDRKVTDMEHLGSATAPLKFERGDNGFVFVGDHSSMEIEDADDYFVFVGDQSAMERDPALRLVSSEVSIWKSVRKEAPPKSGLPLGILLERTWDTAEDIFMHLRRIPYEKGWSELTPEEETTRKTIVILGSGWAAHALMKVADCNKLRLVVVSPSNHFVFTPMLASAAVGTVEYRSMTEAVRAANPMIDDYLEGTATAVDVANKTVTVKLNNLLHDLSDAEVEPPTLTLGYDHLVVSVGARVDDRGVPGADRALRLKSTDDARRLRTAVGECFEYASRPDVSSPEAAKERSRRVTFLIVGGGPTGVELAGELHDLFEDVTRPHKGTYPKLAGSVRVILAHGGPNLVQQFEDVLQTEALNSLKKKGVEVILNSRITEVGDGYARLSTKVFDPITGRLTDEREDSVLPVGLTVWCAGTAPVPFVKDLLSQLAPEARNKDGRVKVDQWMRPPMRDPALSGSILVLGDAASFGGLGGSDGTELPATAQVAGQQGAYVARLLNRGYELHTTPPLLPCTNNDIQETFDVFNDPLLNGWLRFRGLDMAPKFGFLNLGMLAYLGGGEALSQVQLGDVPILAWAGSVAFVLWRSVYLVKQVATRNRILVTFDWIKSALFGRDITRL